MGIHAGDNHRIRGIHGRKGGEPRKTLNTRKVGRSDFLVSRRLDLKMKSRLGLRRLLTFSKRYVAARLEHEPKQGMKKRLLSVEVSKQAWHDLIILMKGVSKAFLACLISLTVLGITLILARSRRESVSNQDFKEDLVHIRSGDSAPITYGFFQTRSIRHGRSYGGRGYEFVLLLRNVGDKIVNLGTISENNFELVDARNKKLIFHLNSAAPKSLLLAEATTLVLKTDWDAELLPPFSLKFQSTNVFDHQLSIVIEKFNPIQIK